MSNPRPTAETPPPPLLPAATEEIDARYQGLDAWPSRDVLAAVLESNRRATEAAGAALDALNAAAAGIESRLSRGGRLVYIGAGTSGRLALQDAAELPPTFGFERTVVLMAGGDGASEAAVENAEDDADAAVRAVDAAEVGPDDAAIGIAASGRTPYTLAGIRRAREAGAFTVGVANNPGAPLLAAAEVGVLLETGPEVLAGSTRLAAGTAQKIALGALSTTVLVRLGGAYDNLMVGMRPQNAKLRVRAADIVAQGARVERSSAASALEGSGWRIREAIVMLRAGVDTQTAHALLEAHHGRIRDVLAALEARG